MSPRKICMRRVFLYHVMSCRQICYSRKMSKLNKSIYLWARRTRRRHVSRIIDQSFSDQSQPSIRILCAAFLGNPLHCSVPCMKSITTSCSARSVNQLPPKEQNVNDEDSIGKDYGASSGDIQCLHIMMARLAVNLAGT